MGISEVDAKVKGGVRGVPGWMRDLEKAKRLERPEKPDYFEVSTDLPIPFLPNSSIIALHRLELNLYLLYESGKRSEKQMKDMCRTIHFRIAIRNVAHPEVVSIDYFKYIYLRSQNSPVYLLNASNSTSFRDSVT